MHRVLSLYDIRSIPEANEVFSSGDTQRINNVLYDVGFDLKEGVVLSKYPHRPMSMREVVDMEIYVGSERIDDEWVSSGNCTYENRLELLGRKDPKFLEELLNMSKRISFAEMVSEHMNDGIEDRNFTIVVEKDNNESH